MKNIVIIVLLTQSISLAFGDSDLSNKKLTCIRDGGGNYSGDIYTIHFIDDKKYELIYFKITGTKESRKIYRYVKPFIQEEGSGVPRGLPRYRADIDTVKLIDRDYLRADNGYQFKLGIMFIDRETLLVNPRGDRCTLFNGTKQELFNTTRDNWENSVSAMNLIDDANKKSQRDKNKF